MFLIKKIALKGRDLMNKGVFISSMLVVSGLTYAENNSDIANTIIQGSVGQTLGKGGKLWVLLTAVTFAVSTFYAASKSDPKAFIPAFIVMALISTVTGTILTF